MWKLGLVLGVWMVRVTMPAMVDLEEETYEFCEPRTPTDVVVVTDVGVTPEMTAGLASLMGDERLKPGGKMGIRSVWAPGFLDAGSLDDSTNCSAVEYQILSDRTQIRNWLTAKSYTSEPCPGLETTSCPEYQVKNVLLRMKHFRPAMAPGRIVFIFLLINNPSLCTTTKEGKSNFFRGLPTKAYGYQNFHWYALHNYPSNDVLKNTFMGFLDKEVAGTKTHTYTPIPIQQYDTVEKSWDALKERLFANFGKRNCTNCRCVYTGDCDNEMKDTCQVMAPRGPHQADQDTEPLCTHHSNKHCTIPAMAKRLHCPNCIVSGSKGKSFFEIDPGPWWIALLVIVFLELIIIVIFIILWCCWCAKERLAAVELDDVTQAVTPSIRSPVRFQGPAGPRTPTPQGEREPTLVGSSTSALKESDGVAGSPTLDLDAAIGASLASSNARRPSSTKLRNTTRSSHSATTNQPSNATAYHPYSPEYSAQTQI